MAKTRFIDITDKVKQYFAPAPLDGGIPRGRDFLREYPGQLFVAAKSVAKSLAAAPIRVGTSLAEIPKVALGGEPFKPFNVPLLGKTKTYAREAVDTQNQLGGGGLATAAGITGAGGKAILDTLFVSKAGQALYGAGKKVFAPKPKDLSLVQEAPVRGKIPVKDAIQNVKNSQPFDVDRSINQGLPREWVYKNPTGKILTAEFAEGRINDVAQKLDLFEDGLGDVLRENIDVNNTTYDDIVQTGIDLINSPGEVIPSTSIAPTDVSSTPGTSPAPSVPSQVAPEAIKPGVQVMDISKIKPAIVYGGTPGKEFPMNDWAMKNFDKINPEIVDEIAKGTKFPPIPLKATPDGFVLFGDGGNRYSAYKFLGIDRVPVQVVE